MNCIARAVFWIIALILSGATYAESSFDGITIISFEGKMGNDAIADGDHIIVFVSGKGSYVSVATEFRGIRRGCISAAESGSYTGNSIRFGVPGELRQRKYKQDTLCPQFSLQFEDEQTVRVRAGDRYSRAHPVIARIPLLAVDFSAQHFMRHEIRGVRLGPVLDPADVGPARGSPGGNQLVYKGFRRDVGEEAGRQRNVQGRAAPAEITGWPWDVLYWASYIRHYEQKVAGEALRDAVLDKYGPPTAESPERDYWVWLYDLDGELVKAGSGSNACAVTADYWLATTPGGGVSQIKPEAGMRDFGPWGCSLMMELNARGGSGGADQYSVFLTSGYALAISHFLQRIEEPPRVVKKLKSLQDFVPTLE